MIKSSADISRLFSQGRRIHTSFFTLIVLKQSDRTDHSGGRVAFIAGKKQGNAVWRNRAKRRMREICRLSGGGFPGYDVVFLAKRNVTSASFSDVEGALKKAACKIKTPVESL